jgi:single-strand DNA-binding protein
MASDLNKWVGIGRLVRDAELKYISSGTPVCKFSLAVGKRIKKNEEWVEEVSFLDIVLWGKSAEALNQYLVKGKQVAVDGELHQNRWEQDGQTRSKVEINASNVQLLGGGNASGEQLHQNSAPNAGAGHSRAPTSNRQVAQNSDEPPDFPDDIPF